jgi:hypothetical protein
MVLEHGFESCLHLKTRWKEMDHLMAENISKIIKAVKWGKSHENNYKNIATHLQGGE